VKYRNILVTGGCGFVGSNILSFLHKAAAPEVALIAFDNLSRAGSELNRNRLQAEGIRVIHGDVRCSEDFSKIRACDLVIDCAAEASVFAGYTTSARHTIDTNIVGTANCLEFAAKMGADLIYFSTTRVYPVEKLRAVPYREGNTRFELNAKQAVDGVSERGISECFPIEGKKTLYGATKFASELLVEEYAHLYNLDTIINRCSLLSGPWQMGKIEQGVISLWAASHVFKGKLTYKGFEGSGKQVRDVLHINDLCALIECQLSNFHTFAGKVFHVGGGVHNSISLQELTALCRDITHFDIAPQKIPQTHETDIPLFITDCSKLCSCCDWQPRMSIRTVVEDLVQWMLQYQQLVRPVFSDI
jgi:CDP-paratose 2-epimerase